MIWDLRARLIMLVTILLTAIYSISYAGNYYEGDHGDWVDKLLNVAGTWDCDSYLKPPKINADGCERDRQVAAAVTLAWQAECLARDGETEKASAAAEQMFSTLKRAAGMCNQTSASQLDGEEKPCHTTNIFDCQSFQP